MNFVTFLVSVPNKFQGICLDLFFLGVFLMFLKYFYFGPGSSSNFFSLKGFFFFSIFLIFKLGWFQFLVP